MSIRCIFSPKFTRKKISFLHNAFRNMSIAPGCGAPKKKGLILGTYTITGLQSNVGKLTPAAETFNTRVQGRLLELVNLLSPPPAQSECRIFYDLDPEFGAVAVVGMGSECEGFDSFENIDKGKEVVRIAAATGIKALEHLPLHKILIESFGHAESAAEGALLAAWVNQGDKNKRARKPVPAIEMYEDCDYTGWQIGVQKANAQNFARALMGMAPNVMTPSTFAQNCVENLCKLGINVEVKVSAWAKLQGMNGFLAVAKGSCEPPIFLELSYYGTKRTERPVVMIGKGVTYNSGGLCLKHPDEQRYMRGDMAGAAVTVATLTAIAGLQLPINIRGLIPLSENMPGCNAMKPGDIVTAMNGKHIKLETTDCAGRLMLADTLVYAQSFWPRFILDIGAMGFDMIEALGPSGCAVFTNSEALWEYIQASSIHSGDKIWRFPLWNHYRKLITNDKTCDITTHGFWPVRGIGGNCNAAAFLNEFLPCGDWLHIDCQNVFRSTGIEVPYLGPGMSGRPTRTLVEFFSQLVCPPQKKNFELVASNLRLLTLDATGAKPRTNLTHDQIISAKEVNILTNYLQSSAGFFEIPKIKKMEVFKKKENE